MLPLRRGRDPHPLSTMRRDPILALLLLSACASAGGTEPLAAPPRVTSSGGTYDVRVSNNTEAAVAVLQASPEAAWAALPQVFQALEIPVTHVESGNRVMGNRDYTAPRRLDGESLERFVNCGAAITGPVASNHTLKLTLLVQVLPAGEGQSRLSTRLDGRARSRQGVSSSVIPCSSTGRLEARVAELLNTALGA